MRSEFQGWKYHYPPTKFYRRLGLSVFLSVACALPVTVMAAGTIGDSDNDGIPDVQDIDDDNDTIPDDIEGTGDTDGDGIIDCLDLDSDNDGIPDLVEAITFDMRSQIDSDFNGQLDSGVSVGENGLADAVETSNESGISLTGINDFDGDGIRDYHDLDSDNDGIPDVVEASSSDSDFNGLYDFFRDLDGDGLADRLANAPILVRDTDEDGAADFRDLDSDGDRLSDRLETSGEDVDGDGRIDMFVDINIDGLNDAYVSSQSTFSDTDQDGFPDYRDTDSDGDGVTDFEEAFAGNSGSNPIVPSAPFSPVGVDEPTRITLETGESGSVFGCSLVGSETTRRGIDPLFFIMLFASLFFCVRRSSFGLPNADK